MMKIGIITSPDREGFESAERRGLQAVEYCIDVGKDVDQVCEKQQELAAASKDTGVFVSSIGRWGTDKILEDGTLNQTEIENSRKLIQLCHALGCENFTTGCNYVDSLSYYQNCTLAIEYFRQIIEYARPLGVKVLAYNCRWNNFVCTDMAYTIILGHLDELGIKYDPSHDIYDHVDYLSTMKKWGNRFGHIHIKGSLQINHERFDDPPAFLDQTNWGAFMSVLYAVGYDGVLSIEPHSPTWRGELGDKGIEFTIRKLKEYIF